MLPRIGITGSVAPNRLGMRRTFLNEPYLVAVRDAGGLPLVITPAHADESLRELYELLDGLVLSGGEDVAPTRFGEAVRYDNVDVLPERDEAEFQLLAWARRDGMPVLAVCRGIQVLNVALGGSLYQDLAGDLPGALVHDQTRHVPPVPRPDPSHVVRVAPGSRLGAIIGDGERRVNSMHHQGIKSLAPALTAVAHAPDGLIEGVEAGDASADGFLLGVQWHPEELARGGDRGARQLFEAFLAAAGKYQRR